MMAAMLSFFFIPPSTCRAQIAGMDALTVLDLSSEARTAGLGLDYLPLFDADPAIAIDNPSLLRSEMCGIGALSFVSLFDGGLFGSLSYAHSFKHIGPLIFSFRFNNYGGFDAYDEEDIQQGTFSAADYAVTVGWAKWIDSNMSIGVNFKPVLSHYESYTALAVAFDVAGSYTSDNRRFAATLMARNIGAQLATFAGTVEELPFDLSVALSYKAANAPFRVFFELNELTRWHLSYDDPLDPTVTVDPYTGKPIVQPWYSGIGRVLDELARHTVVGVELDINHIFFARVGYRYRQMAEMYAVDRTSVNLSGFSYGVGLRTKKFEFSFARRNYHLGQAPTFIALTFKL